MSQTMTDPVGDPLFQLNVLLWLAQPLPTDGHIAPLLHQCGFNVYAISPALGVPAHLQLAAQTEHIAVQPTGRPDVVLAKEQDCKFAFVECKKSSFGPASSTAQQARSFLLISGESAPEALGLNPSQVKGSILGFLMPEDQKIGMQSTLEKLCRELSDRKLSAGRFSILGLRAEDGRLKVSIDDEGNGFFSIPAGSHEVMTLPPDTRSCPLYFIPYDPDLEQSEEERAFCKRILFERIHGTVLVAVGRATPPVDLTLTPKDLLNDSMFGMFDQWQNRESARHMRGLCRQIVTALSQAVNGEAPGTFTYDQQTGWKISLPNADSHNQIIGLISRFSCESMDLRSPLPDDLFDL